MKHLLYILLLISLGCTAKKDSPAKEGKALHTTADSISTIPVDGTEVTTPDSPAGK